MLDYGLFTFATPPRTASTWFRHAADAAGLFPNGNVTQVHFPPPPKLNVLGVTLVRHPCDWLTSQYLSLRGGMIGVPAVDRFSFLARQCMDVETFIRRVMHTDPGSVGRMFDSYQASTVMRVEDLPWNVVEFFESLGVRRDRLNKVQEITPQNARKGHVVSIDKKLRRRVVETEACFCDRYDYWG